MRSLTGDEQALIRRVAERLPAAQRESLLTDLSSAMAQDMSPDRGRVAFAINGHMRPAYRGQHPFPVEGKVLDRDGAELSVLLHADENGRLLELELVRFDEGHVLEPDWNTLQLW
jgi:hypothetical protein